MPIPQGRRAASRPHRWRRRPPDRRRGPPPWPLPMRQPEADSPQQPGQRRAGQCLLVEETADRCAGNLVAVGGRRPTGDQQHHRREVHGRQPAGDLEAIGPRQLDVQQNHVWSQGPGLRERLVAVAGLTDDGETVGLQERTAATRNDGWSSTTSTVGLIPRCWQTRTASTLGSATTRRARNVALSSPRGKGQHGSRETGSSLASSHDEHRFNQDVSRQAQRVGRRHDRRRGRDLRRTRDMLSRRPARPRPFLAVAPPAPRPGAAHGSWTMLPACRPTWIRSTAATTA